RAQLRPGAGPGVAPRHAGALRWSRLSSRHRRLPMTNEQLGERPGGPPRRMVEMDPSGQNTMREPDRGQRQYLNYAFYKLDTAFRRLPREERMAAADEFRDLMKRW